MACCRAGFRFQVVVRAIPEKAGLVVPSGLMILKLGRFSDLLGRNRCQVLSGYYRQRHCNLAVCLDVIDQGFDARNDQICFVDSRDFRGVFQPFF